MFFQMIIISVTSPLISQMKTKWSDPLDCHGLWTNLINLPVWVGGFVFHHRAGLDVTAKTVSPQPLLNRICAEGLLMHSVRFKTAKQTHNFCYYYYFFI